MMVWNEQMQRYDYSFGEKMYGITASLLVVLIILIISFLFYQIRLNIFEV